MRKYNKFLFLQILPRLFIPKSFPAPAGQAQILSPQAFRFFGATGIFYPNGPLKHR